jgi:hypothetical protein
MARGLSYAARPPSGREARERAAHDIAGRVLRSEGAEAATAPLVDAPTQSDRALAARTRSFYEDQLGHDLGSVRVHAGAEAERRTSAVQAPAFTVGDHIWIGDGVRSGAPSGARSMSLLAHELAHVVQQRVAGPSLQRFETKTTKGAGPEQAEASLPARPARPPHEIVLLSGGPASNRADPEHDFNPLNFATAARIRIERLMESAFGSQRQMIPTDRIRWLVMRPPYRYRALEEDKDADFYLNDLRNRSLVNLRAAWDRLAAQAREKEPAATIPTGAQAITLEFINSTGEFVTILNEGSAGERSTMPVGRFEYFGHGGVVAGGAGELWFQYGWQHLKSPNVAFTTDDVRRLDPSAFVSEGEYRSWSCNTATPPGNNRKTFVQAWVERLGGRFVGAVGRTTYAFIISNRKISPRGEPVLSQEEEAYWTTTAAVAGRREAAASPATPARPAPPARPATAAPAVPAARTAPPAPPPGWVHPSELPREDVRTTPEPRLAAIAARAQTASEAVAGEELVCRAEVMPLQASTGGELVCDAEGAGRMEVTQCLQEPQAGAADVPLRGPSPGPEFLPVEELAVELSSEAEPPVVVSPDPDDPAWSPVLRAIAERAYHETFDVQSTPGTLGSAYEVASEVRARSRGFSIGVVERNGRVYYKIFGVRGARGGIPGRWYAARNLPGTSTELAKLVSPRFGALSGLKRGGIGIGGALEVVGTSLDYAIDPKKEFGTDYAVDVSFDVVKAAGSGAAAGAAGAAVTGWLAGGAMGATIGSAAPVVGTVIGFVVGVLASMAIEYFIEDFRASLKARLRGRGGGTRGGGGGGKG